MAEGAIEGTASMYDMPSSHDTRFAFSRFEGAEVDRGCAWRSLEGVDPIPILCSLTRANLSRLILPSLSIPAAASADDSEAGVDSEEE